MTEQGSGLGVNMAVSLTPVERTLITLLQENTRNYRQTSRAAGIAESTCLERVRSLQDRGVIRGWHAEIDMEALGRPIRGFISIRLQPKTTNSVHTFRRR